MCRDNAAGSYSDLSLPLERPLHGVQCLALQFELRPGHTAMYELLVPRRIGRLGAHQLTYIESYRSSLSLRYPCISWSGLEESIQTKKEPQSVPMQL
jgi:hypothetical protein